MVVNRGKYRGLKLKTLDGDNTRPTLAKVKEAIFSMLQMHVYDANVLDLFAGSAALGIEALSENAKHVDFNDSAKEAILIIQDNLKKLKGENSYQISNDDYQVFLTKAKKADKKYDLVFLDPPYKQHLINEILLLLETYELLSEDAIVVCESELEEKVNEETKTLEMYKEKKYGSTKVRMFRRK